MPKRPLTPTYIFFYLLFWPDTWRIGIGLAAALLIAPRLSQTHDSLMTTGMLFVMLTAIGYAVSAKPAHIITVKLRRLILRNH